MNPTWVAMLSDKGIPQGAPNRSRVCAALLPLSALATGWTQPYKALGSQLGSEQDSGKVPVPTLFSPDPSCSP